MKKFKVLLFVLISFFIFVGCSTKTSDRDYGEVTPGDENQENDFSEDEETLPTRKIIYTASCHISTKDLQDTTTKIKRSLEADEWIDYERHNNQNVYLIIRVKSARLDTFVESFSEYGDIGNFSKEAKDISLAYQNNTNKIASLEAEHARLVILYANSGISDMITINKRISEIELELDRLSGILNQYDSLIEYSTVNITIYEHAIIKETTFSQAIKKAFNGGFNALVSLLRYVVLALSAIIPFLIIIVPVGGIAFFYSKYKKKKKS